MSLQATPVAGNSRTSSPGSSFQENNIDEILQSLISLPLENHHLIRVHLGCSFRHAIQTAPAHQPYHMLSIVNSARALADQTVPADEKSLEARIFQAGGTRALVAFAIACQTDKDVHTLTKDLDKDQLHAFIISTASIKAHPKFDLNVCKINAAEPSGDNSTRRVPAPRNWKGRGQKAKDISHKENSAKRALQRKKRKLVDDQDARKIAKLRSSRKQSIHPDTEMEAKEALRDNASQHEPALFADSELPRETPTLGDGGDHSKAASQNQPSGTTKPAEAARYSHQPFAFGSQGMHTIPGNICESKYPAPEHDPPLTGAADGFNIGSIMIPSFDGTFAPNTIETETAADCGAFDIGRIMSPGFDTLARELTGPFNVEPLNNPVTRVHAQEAQDTPSYGC